MTIQQQTQTLRRLFRAIIIESPQAITFAGQPMAVQPTGAADEQTNHLVEYLQQQIYLHAYSRRFTGLLAHPPTPNGHDDLTAVLSQANKSKERWDRGWQITQVLPNGQIAAQKLGMIRTLWAGEFIHQDGPGAPPRPGSVIHIYLPRESTAMQPGFYFAFGEASGQSGDLMSSVRFYWNVTAEGATMLLQTLTETANRYQLPFRFKCANMRSFYYRIDSAILFVERRYAQFAAELLRDVYTKAKSCLEPDTPLFTRRLAPGFSFAEEPGDGESFGMSRCRLVSEGIWQAFLQGSQQEQTRLQAVRQVFRQAEIDMKRPYLRPGAVDCYEFPEYK